MHKVFISYHHATDQAYKDWLVTFGEQNQIFISRSVDKGDIPDDPSVSDQSIREIIRDEYLRDSTVTIVLVGTETKRRKHVDWEIYSSMYDGVVNKKSGVLVLNLPGTSERCSVAHDNEKRLVYPGITSWTSVHTRTEYERRYPHMPDRIIDNLLKPQAKVSVAPWNKIDVAKLKFLIDATFRDRGRCEYDLSRRMRRANS